MKINTAPDLTGLMRDIMARRRGKGTMMKARDIIIVNGQGKNEEEEEKRVKQQEGKNRSLLTRQPNQLLINLPFS